jgi:NAD(P)H dehydrogenase (quinone)
MAKVLIVYYSRTGNTEEMAKAVEEGAKAAGAEVIMKRATEATAADLLNCDTVAFGSPTNFAYMAGALKEFFDCSLGEVRGKVSGKPYCAFGSGRRGTRKVVEVIEGICDALELKKATEGIVATGKPTPEVLAECRELGKKIASVKG